MRERLLPNWLAAYNQWTLPRSEAPASMVLWAGLFTLSSALKRKVCIPKSLMGSYEIYPNLYVIFVAPPGVARKSTTAGYAEELLINLTEYLSEESINFAATSSSVSKLIDVLSRTEDGSLTVLSSEFSSFIGTSKESMYEFLTDIYDGKRKFEYATRSHNLELTEKPVVNLLAATTPSWISRQPPEHFIGGGFASRVLFIFAKMRRQFKLYFDDIDYRQVNIIGEMLANDLAYISENCKGEFRHENKETKEMIENWYREHAKSITVSDPVLTGYLERKHVHIHKVAMLLSIAERDDLIITQAHFEAAKLLLNEVETKLPRALSSVSNNTIGRYMYEVQDFIYEKEQVTKKQIRARFARDLRAEEIAEVLLTLETLGKVSMIPNGINPTYKAIIEEII